MRRAALGGMLGGAILCISIIASGQSPCDFEPPASTISMADLSFSYRHFDDGRTAGIETSGGWLAGRLERLHDSPDFGYTTWASTQIELSNWLATSWLTSGSISYRYYFADDLPLFAYAGVRVDAATFFVQPGCEIRSGIGIGRFRDVTPLAKADRIIAHLLRSGLLPRPFTRHDSMRIAEQIAREDSYGSFEEYVASVAELVGQLAVSTLNSSAVLAIREELGNDTYERYCGAILQVGVGYELVDPYRGAEDVLYVLSGDVGRALSPDSQLRCRLSWSGVSDDVLGEGTSALELTYDAHPQDARAVRAGCRIQQVASGQSESVTSQRATVEYSLGIGRADLVLALAMTHESGTPKWSTDLSISCAIELL